MQRNKLVELTPDKWGLLVYLNERDAVDLTTVKCFMNDIAESRLALAEDSLSVAEKLFETSLSNRTVIHKSYYSMYHAARSAVYIQMQLDVKEHRSLVGRFKKLLIRQLWLFNFFWLGVMAKKSNHRGRGGHRALLFSLCSLCSLWFSEPIPEDNKKSQAVWR